MGGRARIPLLAKHSYLDTAARKISERGFTKQYLRVIAGISIFYIIFIIAFISMINGLMKIKSTLQVTIFCDILIGSSAFFFIIAVLSLMIVVKDFFHIDLGANEEFLVRWFISPIKPLVYTLCGIIGKSEDHIAKDEFRNDDVLPFVQDMIQKSELRIRRDVKLQGKKLRKSM